MTVLNKTILNYKQETEMKRETETSLRQQIHKYETSGVVFYLFLVQFISQNESIISKYRMNKRKKKNKTAIR